MLWADWNVSRTELWELVEADMTWRRNSVSMYLFLTNRQKVWVLSPPYRMREDRVRFVPVLIREFEVWYRVSLWHSLEKVTNARLILLRVRDTLRTPNQIKLSTPATECARNVFTDSEDLRASQIEISGPFAVARICSRFGWNETFDGDGLVDATHFTDRFEDRISHINVCESLLHVAIILFFICDQHISEIKAVCCFNIVGALCFRMSHTCVVVVVLLKERKT